MTDRHKCEEEKHFKQMVSAFHCRDYPMAQFNYILQANGIGIQMKVNRPKRKNPRYQSRFNIKNRCCYRVKVIVEYLLAMDHTLRI